MKTEALVTTLSKDTKRTEETSGWMGLQIGEPLIFSARI